VWRVDKSIFYHEIENFFDLTACAGVECSFPKPDYIQKSIKWPYINTTTIFTPIQSMSGTCVKRNYYHYILWGGSNKWYIIRDFFVQFLLAFEEFFVFWELLHNSSCLSFVFLSLFFSNQYHGWFPYYTLTYFCNILRLKLTFN